MKDRTACFTGHREISAEEYHTISKQLTDTVVSLIDKGYCSFCAGGAVGFDTMAASTVLMVKRQYPNISLILVLPCQSQTRGWSEADQVVYEQIKAQADKVIYTAQAYSRGCMHRRNRRLVNDSSTCICYLTEKTGGTAYTVSYARKQGLEIINIAQKKEAASEHPV